MTFKEGDWVFCEFELQQVKRVEDGAVREVSNGYFSLSSSDLTCFPLTREIKRISDDVKHYSDKFHQEKIGLNYPDLSRALISRWVKMCEAKDDKETFKEEQKRFLSFVDKIVEKIQKIKTEKVESFWLFR